MFKHRKVQAPGQVIQVSLYDETEGDGQGLQGLLRAPRERMRFLSNGVERGWLEPTM